MLRVCGKFLVILVWSLIVPALVSARDAKIRLPRVSAKVRKAVVAYLRAGPEEDARALKAVLKSLKGNLALATAALRSSPPLTDARPGSHHGLTFKSAGRDWEYSIHLPRRYSAKERYPVLVLPDHGSVDAEAGIDFWKRTEEGADYILFRPLIIKHRDDRSRFPDGQFFARDQAIAEVMRDALTHLRLHYAVDHAGLSVTGLSQAGYYSWYYAVSFPDQFAAIIPESSGGLAVRAAVLPLAPNLAASQTRILHTRGDGITPYADAQRMRDAIRRAGGEVELISYTEADYPQPPPKLHPGPHHLRLKNVLPWAKRQKRSIPRAICRVIRYRQQGFEGRFRVPPPSDVRTPVTFECEEKDGKLSANQPGVRYLVAPEDILVRRTFHVRGKKVRPRADLKLLLEEFKKLGDPERLVAAELVVTE